MPKTTGRFAPSPSGRMHLGNIFAAAMAWLHARAQGGTFLLRLEDLDTARCKPEYGDLLLDDLRFLGITWDNREIVRQSRRDPAYEEALNTLKEKGLIYPCFCTRAQLHAASAPHEDDGRLVYSGQCRRLSPQRAQALAREKRHSLRVVLPDEDLSFVDQCYGLQRGNPARDWGDLVVRRADGVFAYQLAVVVDDAQSGVTQITRGRDLLTSAVPQLFLYRELGLPAPQYAHIPLLTAPDGKRLSKREKSLGMDSLRRRFSSPEALWGRLFYAIGYLPREEPVSLGQLIEDFSLARLPKEDIVIDEAQFIK